MKSCDKKDLVVAFVPATEIGAGTGSSTKRTAVKASDITEKYLLNIIKKNHSKGLFYAFANTDKFAEGVKRLMEREIEQNGYDEDKTEEEYERVKALSSDEVIAAYNATPSLQFMTVQAKHVEYRPFLYVDIDLKDHYKAVMNDANAKRLVPKGTLDTEKAFKEWVVTVASEKEIKDCLDIIVNTELIIGETSPNMILYTGHGYHIWYTIPCDESFPRNPMMYKEMYRSFAKSVIALAGPNIKYDSSCQNISRNMRMPFMLNSSKTTTNPKKTAPIYYQDLATPSEYLVDFMSRENSSGHRGSYAGNDAGVVRSATELFNIDIEATRTVAYSGMRDIEKNSKMRGYVSSNIKMSAILTFFGKSTDSIQEPQDGSTFHTMKSPLRSDRRPLVFQ